MFGRIRSDVSQERQQRLPDHLGCEAVMRIDPSELGAERIYRLMTGIVVPRPIAWVTSLSARGVLNLAPFSAFTFVSQKPPMLAISVGRKAGVYKDTAHNILDTEEYVIHIADMPLMNAVHESSVEHPPEVSEVELLKLETRASERIKVPRLAVAPIAMECRFRQCLEFGDARSRLIVGEVVMFHLREGLVENGKIETSALDPIARIAGPRYARLGEIIRLQTVFQTPKSTD
jgi:flavin reductase (DIM6/NTAB) family NADH-FMN oxidoreductase RutF